jgi:serine/threonine protein kinase
MVMDQTADVSDNFPALGHFGKYRLMQKLGEGGFGIVYKAYDPDLKVFRAIKVHAIQGGDAREPLKEAQLQAQLIHPNIVQVLSVELFDGRWAIVMEYLDGGDLRDRLKNPDPIALNDILRYTICIASGLRAAHAKNILHHDIKPENILFDSKGVPKVADFGIARIFKEANTDISRVTGTIKYMSPEQLGGIADLRSDIWSLGVMMYEMLAGKHGFEGASKGEILRNITMTKPPSLCSINKTIPRVIERIVMRMLETDPYNRYQTMDDVIKDIQAFQENISSERKRPTRRTWPVGRILVFAVIAGVVACIGYYFVNKASFMNQIHSPVAQQSMESAPAHETKPAPAHETKPTPAHETKPAPALQSLGRKETHHAVLQEKPPQEHAKKMKTEEYKLPAMKSGPMVKHTYVEVRTTPQGAHIYIDGDLKGTAPLKLMLPVGKHRVRVMNTGYQEIDRQIIVEEMMEYPLVFTLNPIDESDGSK